MSDNWLDRKMPPCPHCDGDGWWIDHSDECYETGECVGCDGVQVPCYLCGGTGVINAGIPA